MKILITGAAGFIGFHLAEKLCNQKHLITGIDNLDNYYDIGLKKHRLSFLNKYKNFTFLNADLKDLVKHNVSYDLAINFAAQAGVRLPKSSHHKYKVSNIDGFNSFLKFCENSRVKNIIFASSSSVYGNHETVPFNEDLKLPRPLSEYAASKIKNEIEAKKFFLKHDVNIIGLRFFTVYGPQGRPDMAYFKFANNISSNENITLFNSGLLKRDMTYIDDIIEGIVNSIEYIKSSKVGFQIYNLGNEKPVKTYYLLNLIEKELGKKGLINFISDHKEVKITYSDSSKALKEFGFKPEIDIEYGVSRFINWYKKYFNI